MAANPAASATYGLIRSLWPQKKVYELLLGESPILGMIRKDQTFAEKVRYVGVGHYGAQGVGVTYQDAKDASRASGSKEFACTVKSYYGSFQLEGRLMRQAKWGKDAAVLVDPLKRESKNVLLAAKRDFAKNLHGAGGGALGRILSGQGTPTITLTNSWDFRAFAPKQLLTVSATVGGAEKAGTAEIVSVGTVTNPTLTISGNWNTAIATIAANDYLYKRGTSGKVFSGFDAWCPNHSGAPGTFLTVDRNEFPEMLAGVSVDLSSFTLREAITRLARLVFDNGGAPDTVLMSTRNYEALGNALQGAGVLQMTKATAAKVDGFNIGIEYEAIAIMGPSKMMKCVPDPEMPDDVLRVLTLNTWYIGSTGPMFQWMIGRNPDGNLDGLMVENDKDEFNGAFVSDSELVCEAPGWNGRAIITPPA